MATANDLMGKITSSKDLLMLLLAARGHQGRDSEPIRGRTRLMKMVFLFDKEVRPKFNLKKVIPPEAIPDFAPYHFGPFSDTVFKDLEFLVNLGFVTVKRVGEPLPVEEAAETSEYWEAGGESSIEMEGPDYEEEFSLSSRGKVFVESVLRTDLTTEQKAALDKFKAQCTGFPLRTLLRYVYTKYPDMTTESKIRDEIVSE
jgi:hypothetical protein